MLHKVISGGQTGADQAGLIAARKFGLETGGTCPANWQTQDGPNYLLSTFGLVAEGTYRTRTIANIRNSDGTVLITLSANSPGSILTRNEAMSRGQPFCEIDLNPIVAARQSGDTVGASGNAIAEASRTIHQFCSKHQIAILNVAGNRERGPDWSTTRTVVEVLLAAFDLLDLDGLVVQKS